VLWCALGARMLSLLQDFGYGLRMMSKNPGSTVFAVITLALGIGANAAIFNLVNAYSLRPLPGIHEPEKLLTLQATRDGSEVAFSYPEYEYYTQHNRVFLVLAAYRYAELQLGSGGEPQRIRGAAVSSNYFAILGVQPALGRGFLPEENETPGAHPVVVINYRLWSERFGSDPALVGKPVILNGHPFTVVGIASRDFRGMEPGESCDVWVPLAMYGQAMPGVVASFDVNGFRWLDLIGRLKPAVRMDQAQVEVSYLSRQLELAYPPEHRDKRVALTPKFKFSLGEFEAILFAVVWLLLVIACANVANLLLAQASTRRREFAIRLALGANRGRLIRQVLAEGALLSMLGGAAALLVALWAARLVLPFLNEGDHPLVLDLKPDIRLFGFTFVVAVLSSVAFALAPALQASKADLVSDLKDSPGSVAFTKSRLRSLLVISQVSVSLVLLIGSELLLRTLRTIEDVKPGFESRNVLLASVQPGLQGYDLPQLDSFYRQLLERVENLPGVQAASLASDVLAGGFFREEVAVVGRNPAPSEPWTSVSYNVIAPGYFGTLRVPLVRGREFDWRDTAGAPRVLIINESMSRHLFSSEDPVGKLVRIKDEKVSREVVGVVKDVWHPALWNGRPANIYYPLFQDHPWWRSAVILHVRTASDPMALAPAIAREIQSLDKSLPVFNVRTLDKHIQESLLFLRTTNALMGVAGLVALLLAAVGLYGVMSYAVSRRTQEIGVRMALGAERRDVMKLIMEQGMALTLIGIAVGIVAALASTRVLSSLLYGVRPTDPFSFVAVSVVLSGVALTACYIPARRATKVDPMVALRDE
jgi:predicted permease